MRTGFRAKQVRNSTAENHFDTILWKSFYKKFSVKNSEVGESGTSIGNRISDLIN